MSHSSEFSVHAHFKAVVALAVLAFFSCLHGSVSVSTHEQRVLDTARTILEFGAPWNDPIEAAIPVLVRNDGDLKFSNSGSKRSALINPWIVPVCRDVIRVQKPPLPYWAAATCGTVIGDGIVASRAPSALMGVLSALLMIRLGRRTIGRCGGLFAGAAWISGYFVVSEFRKAMADPYLAFATLLFLVAWIELSMHQRRRGRWILALFGAVVIGSLAKGPVILLHAGLAAGCLAFTFRYFPRLRWLTWLIGLALATSPLLWWATVVHRVLPEAPQLWRYQSIGQFSDNAHDPRPWWYYIPQLPILILPWVLPVANAVIVAIARPRRKLIFPIAWLALTVIVFSFASMKKNAYLLPVLPALCLLVANGLCLVRARWRLGRSQNQKSLPLLEKYIGVGLAAALAIALATRLSKGVTGADTMQGLTMAVGATLGLIIGAWLLCCRSARPDRDVWRVTVAFSMLIVIYLANDN